MRESVKLVCFYGPESTGKTYMTEQMAKRYNTEFVPEVAREFLSTNNFTTDEIVHIGQAHYNRIIERLKTANKFLFCDTDVITTQIYSQHYLGVVPPQLYLLERKITYDLYFLFDIDVPWIADGLRDLAHLRKEMFQIFKDALEKRNIRYTLVTGSWEQRERIVTEKINELL